MKNTAINMPPELWMRQIFDAKAARDGRIIRRSLTDIDRILGRDKLLSEIRRRGYHAVENAGQLVIFCNNEPIFLW